MGWGVPMVDTGGPEAGDRWAGGDGSLLSCFPLHPRQQGLDGLPLVFH